MAFPRLLIVASTAFSLFGMTTLAHAEVITIATLDGPRHASLEALLQLPPPPAPIAPTRTSEDEVNHVEAPVEEPVEAPLAQRWAAAMRAFGHR